MTGVQNRLKRLLEKGHRMETAGDLQVAVDSYQMALKLVPEDTRVLVRLSAIASRVGQMDKAEAFIQRAIAAKPDRWEFHKELGNLFKRQGRLGEAEASLKRAISLAPNSAPAHYDLGIVYQISGRSEEALARYSSAVDCDPDHAYAWNNMGMIHLERKAFDSARVCFLTAIDKNSKFTGAYNNLGNLFRAEKNFQEAAHYYEKSLSIESNQTTVYTLLGNTYQLMHLPEQTIKWYRGAVDLEPGLADHWVNLGTSFHDLGNLQSAIDCYRKALEIDPQLSQAYLNLGVAYKELGRNIPALECFEEAFRFDSTNGTALNHLVVHLYYQCEWKRLDYYNSLLDQMTNNMLEQGEKPYEDPFLNLVRHDRPELNLKVASSWSKKIETDCYHVFRPKPTPKKNKKKLRIGYLSANYKNHPGADLILGILEHYNRNSFEVFCYSWGENDKSIQRKRIVNACDRFIDISRLDDHQAAKRIHSDEVDIIVDLLGYLKNSRLAICAHRPAPIQVRFLGFVGTTGAEFFDYMISDAITTPIDHQRYFSEKLILMPDTYLVNNYAKDDFQKSNEKRTHKTDDTLVFCCFNTSYKLDPLLFGVWMKILIETPGSVLWLMPESSLVKKNLVRVAADYGVEANRLIFKDKVSRKEHFKRLEYCDLALDTRTINGVASTSDAIWTGLPVITLQGKHFASRISSSLLRAVGLPELITTSLEAYASTAIQLANHPQRLRNVRATIEKNRLSGPLFNTAKYVRHLEEAYLRIWDRRVDGKTAQSIIV